MVWSGSEFFRRSDPDSVNFNPNANSDFEQRNLKKSLMSSFISFVFFPLLTLFAKINFSRYEGIELSCLSYCRILMFDMMNWYLDSIF